jgi:hypothetical protein
MVQAVSHRPLTAEARVRFRVSLCGICGGPNAAGTFLFPSSSVSPVSTIPLWLQTHILSWEMSNRPLPNVMVE